MKRLRLWLATKLLGGHIGLDDLIEETYRNVWAQYPPGSGVERQAKLELRLSLTRAFAEGTERSGNSLKK